MRRSLQGVGEVNFCAISLAFRGPTATGHDPNTDAAFAALALAGNWLTWSIKGCNVTSFLSPLEETIFWARAMISGFISLQELPELTCKP
jgi:hypothetical protein